MFIYETAQKFVRDYNPARVAASDQDNFLCRATSPRRDTIKKTVCRFVAVSCFVFAAAAPLADDGMMHHGEFAEKMFKDMDANNDGKVTLDEIKAAYEKMHRYAMKCDGMQDGMMHKDGMAK